MSRRLALLLYGLLAVLIAYLTTAYGVLPLEWRRRAAKHPALSDAPRVSQTASGIAGDPLNLAFVGSEDDLQRAMLAARWLPADPITWKSALRIATASVAHRPYAEAPVSSLYLWGRKQDLAFEQPAGGDPRRRHHVRFWRSSELDPDGHPLWLCAATFDISVGFSHTTGQITHHIAADIDAERDKLLADLQRIAALGDVQWLDGYQGRLTGKNGGGDAWRTDGRLAVGFLSPPKP